MYTSRAEIEYDIAEIRKAVTNCLDRRETLAARYKADAYTLRKELNALRQRLLRAEAKGSAREAPKVPAYDDFETWKKMTPKIKLEDKQDFYQRAVDLRAASYPNGKPVPAQVTADLTAKPTNPDGTPRRRTKEEMLAAAEALRLKVEGR